MHDYSDIQTPFYLYDLDLLCETVDSALEEAERYGYIIHYAIKANNNPVVAGVMQKRGLGADCVSGNEILKSVELGFTEKGIVFAGVGKSDSEIEIALDNSILCFNVESIEELEVIDQIASASGRKARVALRVNPSVDAQTHRYISTGKDENKFGISISQLQKALDFSVGSENIVFVGLHFHIGSQILSLEPYRELCETASRIWKDFRISESGGYILNLGGGLGVDYVDPERNRMPDFASFFKLFDDNLEVPGEVEIHFELGRSLVAQSCRIVTRVLYTKQGVGKNFVITDAGMTELMRPSLYQAVHKITNASSSIGSEVYDIVGPVCESSDVFSTDVVLPVTSRGDILYIHTCGAYGESMTLNFNLRDRLNSFFTSGGKIYSGKIDE